MTVLIITGDGINLDMGMFQTMELSVSSDLNVPDAEFYIVDCPFKVSDLANDAFDQIWLVGKCGSIEMDSISREFTESENPSEEIANAMVDISESAAGADDSEEVTENG